MRHMLRQVHVRKVTTEQNWRENCVESECTIEATFVWWPLNRIDRRIVLRRDIQLRPHKKNCPRAACVLSCCLCSIPERLDSADERGRLRETTHRGATAPTWRTSLAWKRGITPRDVRACIMDAVFNFHMFFKFSVGFQCDGILAVVYIKRLGWQALHSQDFKVFAWCICISQINYYWGWKSVFLILEVMVWVECIFLWLSKCHV